MPPLRRLASAAATLALAGAPTPGGAAGGDLVFEDAVDATLQRDSAEAIAVRGRRVLVAGSSVDGFAAGRGRDWRVRAVDAKTGAVLWDRVEDRGRGLDEEARAIAVRGRRGFVTGDVDSAVGIATGPDWIVQALDVKTGDLLWEDLVDRGGAETARPVAAQGRRVFAGGSGENLADPASGADWLLRALDARSGALLWEDVVDGALDVDEVVALAVKGRRVFAAGRLTNDVTALSGRDTLVRALDARDGALLWEERVDRGERRDDVSDVAVSGRRLFVAGNAADVVDPVAGSGRDGILRALDAKRGTLLWEDVFDKAGGLDELQDVAARGRRVIAVGRSENAAGALSGDDWLVRAHDAKTGALLWEDVLDTGPRDRASAVVAEGRLAWVAGRLENAADPASGLDWVVRAYDLASGALVWEERFDHALGNDQPAETPGVDTLARAGRTVFTVGRSQHRVEATSGRDWLLRALEAR